MPIPAESSAAIDSHVRRRLSRAGSGVESGTLAPAPKKIGAGGVGRTASANSRITINPLGKGLNDSGASESEERKAGEEEKDANYKVSELITKTPEKGQE